MKKKILLGSAILLGTAAIAAAFLLGRPRSRNDI